MALAGFVWLIGRRPGVLDAQVRTVQVWGVHASTCEDHGWTSGLELSRSGHWECVFMVFDKQNSDSIAVREKDPKSCKLKRHQKVKGQILHGEGLQVFGGKEEQF